MNIETVVRLIMNIAIVFVWAVVLSVGTFCAIRCATYDFRDEITMPWRKDEAKVRTKNKGKNRESEKR